MKAVKNVGALQSGAPTAEELKAINLLSKRELSAQEVFKFDVLLCDNRVDRDFERFTSAALEALAGLFYGKTGIFDHNWSAAGQKARIFKTEVVYDSGEAAPGGEGYAYLKASAYMLREGNGTLISEIEGGIKREVSVGCGVKPGICCICGEEHGGAKCAHIKGREYGGKICYAEIREATDAYEWSFVAVPAQRGAGVLKRFGNNPEHFGSGEELFKLAALGESYLKGLRGEVVRLGLLGLSGFEPEVLKSAVERMEEKELLEFKKVFEAAIDEKLPRVCQLTSEKKSGEKFDGGEFLV